MKYKKTPSFKEENIIIERKGYELQNQRGYKENKKI